jgi:hypothetical protein
MQLCMIDLGRPGAAGVRRRRGYSCGVLDWHRKAVNVMAASNAQGHH